MWSFLRKQGYLNENYIALVLHLLIIVIRQEVILLLNYYYDKNMDVYFAENLDKCLLSMGVKSVEIDKARGRILKNEYNDFYCIYDSNSHLGKVPTDRIIGTNRATVGNSVYDNVYRIDRGDREPGRFINCFQHGENASNIVEWRESFFDDIKPVEMYHYLDTDEYFLFGDGNHRTLTALLIGVECINAKILDVRFDTSKKEIYASSKEFCKRFCITKIYKNTANSYGILFSYYPGIIWGYNVFENDFSNILTELESQLNKDLRMYGFVRKVKNEFIKNIIIHTLFRGNKRAKWFEYKNLPDESFQSKNSEIELYQMANI